MAIRIKKHIGRQKKRLEENLLLNDRYIQVDLNSYVPSSLVQNVFILDDCVSSILSWVEQSKRLKPVPEVGGFLLGKFEEILPNSFNISLEMFIPSKDVAYNSPTILEFGTKVMMQLDEQMDKFPDLDLMGWFHTHPGHTPFLSGLDQQLHEGFFKKPYQIALVLDSLTKDFDTGFFTRKLDGVTSNKVDFSDWVLWKKLLANN